MRDKFIVEPSDVYHGKAGEYLSSHSLIDYIKSPVGYYHQHVVHDIPRMDSDAYKLGRAVHTAILEQDKFGSEYVVGGPINKSTGKVYGYTTKAYKAWEQQNNVCGISDEDFETIKTMRESCYSHNIANKLLSDGWAEGVLRNEYCGIQCQIRIDWMNPNEGIVDLKTTENIETFERDLKKYFYHLQLGFYQAVYRTIFGNYPEVYIIAVEKRQWFRTGVWRLTPETLSEARMINESYIPRLLESKTSGIYPTLYESIRTI